MSDEIKGQIESGDIDEIRAALWDRSQSLDGREGVYVLFFKNEIIYVGQSQNMFVRVQCHLDEGIKEFDRIAYIPATKEERLPLERRLIKMFNPKCNRATLASLGFVDTCELERRYNLSFWQIRDLMAKANIRRVRYRAAHEGDLRKVLGLSE